MKDFLLICDKNCATYKEMFPFFKESIVSFGSPVKEYDGTDRKFGNHSWITTFPVPNKKKLILTATYDPALYPKYDNYDAIEVSRVKNIPFDYDGVMGCPITILGYDLDNVEIIGDEIMNRKDAKIDDKEKYTRVLIKKNFEITSMMNGAIGEGLTNGDDGRAKFYTNGKSVYARVLIRRKRR